MKGFTSSFPSHRRPIFSALFLLFLFCGLASEHLFAQGMTPAAQKAEGKDVGFANLSPYPPSDVVPFGTTLQDQTDQRLSDLEFQGAMFAWKQFLALTWKATYNPIQEHFQRGVPDTTWQHGSDIPSHLVFETYAHRTELRPNGPLTRDFDSLPEYSYQVPISPESSDTNQTLLNNLDEDNEIGSCDVYLGNSSQNLVLYQAKVNRAMYDHIKRNYPDQFTKSSKLYKDQLLNQQLIQGLPFGQSTNASAIPSHLNLPASDPFSGEEGVIEIKTAFLKLEEIPVAIRSRFLTRNCIYYEYIQPSASQPYGQFIVKNGTFALIAMHIIRKTAQFQDFVFTSFEHRDLPSMDFKYRSLTPPPPTYGNLNPFQSTNAPTQAIDHEYGDRITIQRQTGGEPLSNGQLYPISPIVELVNGDAQKALAALNSIWQHYRLIGVQSYITNGYDQRPHVQGFNGNVGPNHFMANQVVESDPFLANFFGPGFGGNPLGDGKNIAHVVPNVQNPGTFTWKKSDMGGCKGCHAVAQTAFGTEFSFLLDFDNNKPAITPDPIHHADPPQ